jgi:undecaprenyl diphosphate synthase
MMESKMMPASIAVIMDGNGRWATKRGLPRKAGHVEGAKQVDRIVENCARMGVECLTLYALSTENLKKRPEDELDALMKLFIKFVASERRKLVDNGIKVNVIGDREAFSGDVRESIERLEDYTRQGTGMVLNIALNYGARDELLRAFRLYGEDVKTGNAPALDEESVKQYLYTKDLRDPDLLIRTGGDLRISNFLLYQAAYSELYFTPTLWPDFGTKELEQAIEEFNRRNRRFGGL